MELNVKEQTEKLQAELTQLNNQLALNEHQVSIWRSQVEALKVMISKKQGAIELLQGLNGDKPEEKK